MKIDILIIFFTQMALTCFGMENDSLLMVPDTINLLSATKAGQNTAQLHKSVAI